MRKTNKPGALIPKLRRGALGLLAGSSLFTARTALAAEPVPNIVFILADDLGWTDINCRSGAFDGYIADPDDHSWKYDSTYYETPNIAELRSLGMRFTNAYAACPVCMPSRACIITGRYPSRFQFAGPGPEIDRQYRSEDRLVSAFTRPQLPHEETTIAEALKPNGPGGSDDYVSCFIGKWHLNHRPEKGRNYYLSNPSSEAYSPGGPENGFDFSIDSHGIRRIDGNYWEHLGQKNSCCYDLDELGGMAGRFFDSDTLWGDPDPDNSREYLTDSYTTKAEQFLGRIADPNYSSHGKPFFLYLSHHAVHTPLQGKENYRSYFAATKGKSKRHNNPDYAATVKSLDDSVGRIMARLKSLKLWDNTIIVLTSDNGGASGTDNYPLRGGKGQLYEGGIRVPMIVCWPGHTKPNSTCSMPVFSGDLLPTFLEIAGIENSRLEETYPGFDHTTIDGQSLVPLFEGRPFIRLNDPGDPADDNAIFWHYPMAGTFGSAVLCNGYKLIKSYSDTTYDWSNPAHFDHSTGQLNYNAPGTFELYNLADNIGEDPSKNLYTDKQGKPFYKESQHLKSLVEKWLANINAGMLRPSVRIRNRLYRRIQDAIDSASDGDEIIVYPGVHLETINLGNKNITLRSVNPNDPKVAADTVIHGSGTGTVVTFGGSETSKCILSGLTITGGAVPSAHWRFDEGTGTAAHDIIRGNLAVVHGAQWTTGLAGGAVSFDGNDDYIDCGNDTHLNPDRVSFSISLWVNFSDLDRNNMVLLSKRKDNNNFFELTYKRYKSSPAKGMFDFTARANGVVLIEIQSKQVSFKKNTDNWLHLVVAADRSYKKGGRIYLNGKSLPLQKNKLHQWGYFLAPDANLYIANNAPASKPFGGKIDELMIYKWALRPDQVKTLSAGGLIQGGGIDANNSGATISKCIIRGNSAYEGGGIRNCNGLIENCKITGNRSSLYGGGLSGCSGTIANCIIADNATEGGSGGLYGCNGSIDNCSIVYNLARVGPGLGNCRGTIRHSIIWGNSTFGHEPLQLDSCAVPGDSCIEGWNGEGQGNINLNPCFVNAYQFFDRTIDNAGPFSFFSLKVANANLYETGDVIELDNDGVRRTVTGTIQKEPVAGEVRFRPPVSPATKEGLVIHNWGKSVDDVIEDYHLKDSSPCVEAGIASARLSFNEGIDSQVRFQEQPVDRGADETRPSPTQEDTAGRPTLWPVVLVITAITGLWVILKLSGRKNR